MFSQIQKHIKYVSIIPMNAASWKFVSDSQSYKLLSILYVNVIPKNVC